MIFSVAVSPDNRHIASGSEDKSLQIYDIHTNELIYQFLAAHEDPISCLTFSPDGRSLISGAGDNSIKIFDLQTKKQVHHFVEAQEGKKFIEIIH